MPHLLRALVLTGVLLGFAVAAQAQSTTEYVIYEQAEFAPAVPFSPRSDADPVAYQYDTGSGNINVGPPSTFDPDMLWGNYYLTQPGGEVITHISVAFGPTFPSLGDGPVTFWLLDDPDMDLDPRNATALTSVQATPDVFGNNFYTVEIPPTQVSGAFFVGASAQLMGGQDAPARLDTTPPGDKSWFFYADDISEVINDLASAPFGTSMDDPEYVPFFGAFMVRAYGIPAGSGKLVFNPTIATGLTVTTDAGTTASGSFTITNEGSAAVDYTFPHFTGAMRARTPGVALSVPRGQADPRPGIGPRDQGGPDAFGYSWIDSNEPGGPSYSWTDISAAGQELTELTGTWDGNTAITLPFAFEFYGQTYTQATVSVNGWMNFDMYDGAGWSNQPIPTSDDPSNFIAPFWDDLDMRQQGAVYAYHDAGAGTFTLQWTDVEKSFEAGSSLTFQLVLSNSGTILFQYADLDAPVEYATVGIEGPAGDDGLQVVYSAPYLENDLAIRISAAPTFVTDVTPASGVIAPGETVTITVDMDATDLFAGTYSGALMLETDEAGGLVYEYPVTLVVEGEAGCTVTPEALAFGTVIVGTEASLDVLVANEGTAACTIESVASSHGAFEVDFDEDVTVQPGQSVTFAVTFAPAEAGAASGALTVTVDGSDVTLPLSGTGVAAPVATVEPAALTLVVASGDSGTGSVVLSNAAASGASELSFSAWFDHTEEVMVDFEDGQRPPEIVLGNMGNFVAASGGNPGQWLRNNTLAAFAPSLYIGPSTDSPFLGNYVERNVESISVDAQTLAAPFGVEGRPYSVVLVNYNGQPHDVEAHHRVYYTGPLAPQPGEGWSEYSFDIPSQYEGAMPEGWSGGHYEDPEGLPEGVEWQDVISSVDEVWLMWGHPAYFYLLQDFDIGVDNIGIRFSSPFGGPITVEPESGDIAPGDDITLTVHVDASDLEEGEYLFELQIDTNDPAAPRLIVPVTVEIVTVSSEGESAPLAFGLEQNYPNPFGGQTVITYTLAETSPVRIDVYDVAGRRVATLVDGPREAGRHTATWDASGLAAGVYLYRIQAGAQTATRRALLTR
jgi:hypothetical protein